MRSKIDLSTHALASPASPTPDPLQKPRPTSNSYNHRRLIRLFDAQGGLCHWCTAPMILEWLGAMRQPTKRHATIDHLWDRYDPRRYAARAENREVPKVAACFGCNQARCARRNAALMAANPQHYRERSGVYGVARQRAALRVGVLLDETIASPSG